MTTVCSTRRPSLWLAAMTALGAALVGCKGSPSAPNDFGVNVTVDAHALSSAQKAVAVTGLLRVTGADTELKQLAIGAAIGGGQLRFHYVPKAQSGSLSFGFDVIDANDVVLASGAGGPVTLTTGAVAVTITLAVDGSGKKGDGFTCSTGTDCASGFCTDGVCCNEACNDTCVSCAVDGSKGVCAAYAADTDPEGECGGSVTAAKPADGGTDASAPGADGGSDDGGDADGGAALNAPDGGVITTPKLCAGTCNGARACNYPQQGTTCGDPFCNSSRDQASFTCDGKGNCALGLSACTAYACDFATALCRTQCASNADCLSTDYCNGNNQCVPQKADGIECLTPAECQSAVCTGTGGAAGVCCNTVCDAAGFNCSTGECQCPACTTGACQVFYQDVDGDGYGNKAGNIADGTAKAACAGAPPAGFVADNTDCDDKDANVHPGQTSFFTTVSRGTGTFDYDCDGTNEKQLNEYPGASCVYCGSPGSCSTLPASCTSGAQSSLACTQEISILRFESSIPAVPPGSAALTISPIIFPTCCGCDDHSGFAQTVDCGNSATYYTCGSCGGAATTGVEQTQGCR